MVKLKLRDLRLMLESMVTLDTLENIQNELDDMLLSNTISQDEYAREWDEVLHSVGWTQEKYDSEVDRRWTYIGSVRAKAPEIRYKN